MYFVLCVVYMLYTVLYTALYGPFTTDMHTVREILIKEAPGTH